MGSGTIAGGSEADPVRDAAEDTVTQRSGSLDGFADGDQQLLPRERLGQDIADA